MEISSIEKTGLDDALESAYMRGRRRAYLDLLYTCLIELGYDDPESQKTSWIVEREEAIVALRGACERLGDNDWPNDLELSDVIDKHLVKHLYERK